MKHLQKLPEKTILVRSIKNNEEPYRSQWIGPMGKKECSKYTDSTQEDRCQCAENKFKGLKYKKLKVLRQAYQIYFPKKWSGHESKLRYQKLFLRNEDFSAKPYFHRVVLSFFHARIRGKWLWLQENSVNIRRHNTVIITEKRTYHW